MKKVLFIAVVAVASLASCKKDRTCTCTTTFSNGTKTQTDITDYPKSSKKAAVRNCAIEVNNDRMMQKPLWTKIDHIEAVGTNPAYTKTKTCELK